MSHQQFQNPQQNVLNSYNVYNNKQETYMMNTIGSEKAIFIEPESERKKQIDDTKQIQNENQQKHYQKVKNLLNNEPYRLKTENLPHKPPNIIRKNNLFREKNIQQDQKNNLLQSQTSNRNKQISIQKKMFQQSYLDKMSQHYISAQSQPNIQQNLLKQQYTKSNYYGLREASQSQDKIQLVENSLRSFEVPVSKRQNSIYRKKHIETIKQIQNSEQNIVLEQTQQINSLKQQLAQQLEQIKQSNLINQQQQDKYQELLIQSQEQNQLISQLKSQLQNFEDIIKKKDCIILEYKLNKEELDAVAKQLKQIQQQKSKQQEIKQFDLYQQSIQESINSIDSQIQNFQQIKVTDDNKMQIQITNQLETQMNQLQLEIDTIKKTLVKQQQLYEELNKILQQRDSQFLETKLNELQHQLCGIEQRQSERESLNNDLVDIFKTLVNHKIKIQRSSSKHEQKYRQTDIRITEGFFYKEYKDSDVFQQPIEHFDNELKNPQTYKHNFNLDSLINDYEVNVNQNYIDLSNVQKDQQFESIKKAVTVYAQKNSLKLPVKAKLDITNYLLNEDDIYITNNQGNLINLSLQQFNMLCNDKIITKID